MPVANLKQWIDRYRDALAERRRLEEDVELLANVVTWLVDEILTPDQVNQLHERLGGRVDLASGGRTQ